MPTSAHVLPGIPTHKAVVYLLDMPAPRVETGWRTKHTAVYARTGKVATGEDKRAMSQTARQTRAKEADDDRLEVQWQSWHAKAEAALKTAVAKGIAEVAVKPERDKGTFTEPKRKADKAQASGECPNGYRAEKAPTSS